MFISNTKRLINILIFITYTINAITYYWSVTVLLRGIHCMLRHETVYTEYPVLQFVYR